MTTKIEDVGDLAIERLPSQFQDKPKMEAFIRALVGPDQTAEDVLWQMLTERTVDDAVGAQLDVIGRIVGEDRQGKIDADYRRYVKAAIRVNKSNGTGEELYTIAGLIVDLEDATYVLTRKKYATIKFYVNDVEIDDDLATVLIKFLTRAASGSARVLLETQPEDVARRFMWGTSLWSDHTNLQPTTDDLWNDVREITT